MRVCSGQIKRLEHQATDLLAADHERLLHQVGLQVRVPAYNNGNRRGPCLLDVLRISKKYIIRGEVKSRRGKISK